MVVLVGETDCVPPVAVNEKVVESALLLTTTVVALAAVTVRVDDAPDAIDDGLAVRVTVGIGLLVPPPPPLLPPPPQALIPISRITEEKIATNEAGGRSDGDIVLRG